METCIICEKPLLSEIDKVGDMRHPVCVSCWLEYGTNGSADFSLSKEEWINIMCATEIMEVSDD